MRENRLKARSWAGKTGLDVCENGKHVCITTGLDVHIIV
jgi:hypothetical protein